MRARCRRFLIWCAPMPFLVGLLILGGERAAAGELRLASDEAPCAEAAAGGETVDFAAFTTQSRGSGPTGEGGPEAQTKAAPAEPAAPAAPAAPGKICTTNAQCPKASYCAKPAGECKGKGECKARPQICPDVYLPVCGCNNKTYSNDCWAAMAGVNVKAEGACPRAAKCKTNAQCGAGDFCAKPDGKCEDEGLCAKRPQFCPLDVNPVCGCTGKTFNNRCEAFRAGVDVKHPGKCER